MINEEILYYKNMWQTTTDRSKYIYFKKLYLHKLKEMIECYDNASMFELSKYYNSINDINRFKYFLNQAADFGNMEAKLYIINKKYNL